MYSITNVIFKWDFFPVNVVNRVLRDRQLSFYVSQLESLIPNEDDLDVLLGSTIVNELNQKVTDHAHELPFVLMPKIYNSLQIVVDKVRHDGDNPHSAYQVACEYLSEKNRWAAIPSGKGTVEERISRASRILRQELDQRGDLMGARNIYIGDLELLRRCFD